MRQRSGWAAMQRPDIDEYEVMVAAATAGPWEEFGGGDWDRQVESAACVICRGPGGYDGDSNLTEPDATLIAASRTAVPELCAYIKYLEGKIDLFCGESLDNIIGACQEIDALKSIIRDWLAECPSMCGQCDDVRARAEGAVK